MFGLNLKDRQVGRMLDRQDDFVILALESSADRASAAVVRTGMPGIKHLHEARHGHAALISELARAALALAVVAWRRMSGRRRALAARYHPRHTNRIPKIHFQTGRAPENIRKDRTPGQNP